MTGRCPRQLWKRSLASGYLHRSYAYALREFGTPRPLPGCGGWILERHVPQSNATDGMGCYPFFACQDWSALAGDVAGLGTDLISLTLVADPLGDYAEPELKRTFPDRCVPYKQHFVVDLTRPAGSSVSAHHRRNVARAAAQVDVECCDEPARYADEWLELYRHLVTRHRIRGIAAFSSSSLREQLMVPGLRMFRAAHRGVTIGITLWFVQNDSAYYHLGAYSNKGYELRASFALFDFAIHDLARRVHVLSLGAGAGVQPDPSDGLTQFKQGWATGTRTAWLCGLIFDRERYAALSTSSPGSDPTYFPAYRAGEFT